MLSCKETAMLASRGLVEKLPFRKRMAIRLHLFLCSACRETRRQMEFLQGLFSKYGRGDLSIQMEPRLRLSDDARQRIQRTLKD